MGVSNSFLSYFCIVIYKLCFKKTQIMLNIKGLFSFTCLGKIIEFLNHGMFVGVSPTYCKHRRVSTFLNNKPETGKKAISQKNNTRGVGFNPLGLWSLGGWAIQKVLHPFEGWVGYWLWTHSHPPSLSYVDYYYYYVVGWVSCIWKSYIIYKTGLTHPP